MNIPEIVGWWIILGWIGWSIATLANRLIYGTWFDLFYSDGEGAFVAFTIGGPLMTLIVLGALGALVVRSFTEALTKRLSWRPER